MKIYNWIDSLFDSKEKRRLFVLIVLLLYWIWQNVWQSVLFFQMAILKDYESIFTLLAGLNKYSNSVLVRILSLLISQNYSLLSKIYGWDVAMFVLTFLLFLSSKNKKKWIFCILCFVGICIWSGAWIYIGYQHLSLMKVIWALKMLAIGNIGIEVILISLLNLTMVKNIEKYMCSRNVNNYVM